MQVLLNDQTCMVWPLIFIHRIRQAIATGLVLAVPLMACAQSPAIKSSIPAPNVTWPRLFFDVQERQQIELDRAALHRSPVSPTTVVTETQATAPSHRLITSLTLQGISQTNTNVHARSAWINGETVRPGDTYGGWTVDVQPNHVRLSAPEQADVVLRPGERIDVTQSNPVDIVPHGSFNIKKPISTYKISVTSYENSKK